MFQKISVVIPTKNEAANIGRCLSSVVSNGYPAYEIIIVDQSSTDQTVAIAKQYKAKVINVPATEKYVPPSQSRNLGFKHSHGDIIYHVDADMELEKGLLAEISKLFSDTQTSALIVPEADIPANFWATGKAFERSLYRNTNMEAARVTTKTVFTAIQYATDITSGEDWYIHSRYKSFGDIKRTTRIVRHYIGSVSLSREFNKKLYYGSSSANYLGHNRSDVTHRFFFLSCLYVKGIILNIFSKPTAIIAFLVIRSVDTLALITGLVFYRQK